MFQPRVKLKFVRRYCAPKNGWKVFVDIDASEEGRTGGERTSGEARKRQRQMKRDGQTAREELRKLGATVGGDRATWYQEQHLPHINGDRDIVAFNKQEQLYVIAEVGGNRPVSRSRSYIKPSDSLSWRQAMLCWRDGSDGSCSLSTAGISVCISAEPTHSKSSMLWQLRSQTKPTPMVGYLVHTRCRGARSYERGIH